MAVLRAAVRSRKVRITVVEVHMFLSNKTIIICATFFWI